MIGCRRYRRHLPLWVGGDLDERLALRLRLHVKNCPSCAAAARALRRARSSLEQAAGEPVPMKQQSLWPQLRPLCRAEKPQRVDPRGWLPTLSLAAACASVLVGMVLLPSVPTATPPLRAQPRRFDSAAIFGPVSVEQPARADDRVWVDFDRLLLLPDANRYSENTRGRF
jgi:anti-sigma factor RsiW